MQYDCRKGENQIKVVIAIILSHRYLTMREKFHTQRHNDSTISDDVIAVCLPLMMLSERNTVNGSMVRNVSLNERSPPSIH